MCVSIYVRLHVRIRVCIRVRVRIRVKGSDNGCTAVIRIFYPRSFYYTPGHFLPPPPKKNRFATPFSYGEILPQLREF